MIATIKEVAKEAGVSVATVSRVLNNKGYVNEDTRKRVMSSIEKLNYKPNAVARSLFKKKSKMIGLIVPDIKNPFFPELARAVEDVTNSEGYTLILCNSDDDFHKEQKYLDALKQKYVDGFIVVTSTLKAEHVEDHNIPLVALDRSIHPEIPAVYSNNYTGAKQATQYLLELGCRQIAHIRGPHHINNAEERYKGFTDVTKDQGLYDPKLVINGGYSIEKTIDVTSELLKKSPEIDGIFAGNDMMAIGVLKAAERLGLKVPEDLKIIGFDGIALCKTTSPEITTMAQPIYEMGTTAARMLLDFIEKKEVTNMKQVFQVQLVERQSTRVSLKR